MADLFPTSAVAPANPGRASAASLETLPSLAGVNKTGIAKFQARGSSEEKAAATLAAKSAERSQEQKHAPHSPKTT